ncbi:MAG: sulfite exporter TauE/SafE family protein [bacterium]
MKSNLLKLLIEGIFLGLTLGSSCLVTCAPVFAPVILAKKGGITSGFRTIIFISAGRFVSYAVFGFFTGYFASKIGDFPQRTTVIAVSYLLIAAYLTYFALIQNRFEKGHCLASSKLMDTSSNPFIIGILTGISICPAFVAAIAKGLDSGGIIGGMIIFTGLFFGTTVYLLPLSFLSLFTKQKVFRYVGITASILVACWFVYEGVLLL